MARCSVKAQGQLYLDLLPIILPPTTSLPSGLQVVQLTFCMNFLSHG